MTFRGLLVDFYGTLVHEDDDIIRNICDRVIKMAEPDVALGDIAAVWNVAFSDGCRNACGPTFRTQRDLERASLETVLAHFGVDIAIEDLEGPLFEYWQKPTLYDDAQSFLDAVSQIAPVCVVSNIDRADIEAAIAHHDLKLDLVITSEDVGSYKPRPAMFRAAVELLDVAPSDVVHLGDSLSSDVQGAQDFGVRAAWLNRSGRVAKSVSPEIEVSSLTEFLALVAEGHR